jgi:hypothetical protein
MESTSILQRVIQLILSLSHDSLIPKSTIEEGIQVIHTSASPTHHAFGFQQAFEMPKFQFHLSERTLIPSPKPTSAFGTASDKLSLFQFGFE